MGDPTERGLLRDLLQRIRALFRAQEKGTMPTGYELLEEFKAELRTALERGMVTDATVQQIGSAVTGWETDPNKPPKPWSPEDGAEYVVFSGHALAQAMEAGLTPDTTRTMGGKYLFIRTEGFYGTSVGKQLEALATQWSPQLGGPVVFRLALGSDLFEDGIVILLNANGIREAMRIAYEKQRKEAERGAVESDFGPHITGLLGAVRSRMAVNGLPITPVALWHEVAPFALIEDEEVGAEALAEYAVYVERTTDTKLAGLRETLNSWIRRAPDDHRLMKLVTNPYAVDCRWQGLLEPDVLQRIEVIRSSRDDIG